MHLTKLCLFATLKLQTFLEQMQVNGSHEGEKHPFATVQPETPGSGLPRGGSEENEICSTSEK